MKNFWTVLGAILAFFGILIATLVIIDKVKNKNRIKGEYLECDDINDLHNIDD